MVQTVGFDGAADVNPHAPSSLSPLVFVRACFRRRELLSQLTRRAIAQRYQGSVLGVLWSLLQPVLMLGVYTFVFSTVLKGRWSQGVGSTTEFAVVLFAGLCVYNLFSEIVNRAPALIVDHSSYVKRVVFPLEMLALVNVGAAMFQFSIQMTVLLITQSYLTGHIVFSGLIVPLVVLPLLLFSLGLTWFLSSIGVFLRDIGPVVALSTTALMFLSPVFYAMDAVPERFRFVISLNPLTIVINQVRDAAVWGIAAEWQTLVPTTLGQIVFAWAGYCWFQCTKKGFADVL